MKEYFDQLGVILTNIPHYNSDKPEITILQNLLIEYRKILVHIAALNQQFETETYSLRTNTPSIAILISTFSELQTKIGQKSRWDLVVKEIETDINDLRSLLSPHIVD